MSQIFWCQRDVAPRGVPCLFLDRDGVVVQEVNYLGRPEDVCLQDGARQAVALARSRGFVVGLVTNQAGIGRGYYRWEAFLEVQDEIVRQLGLGPEPFDFVAACGTHPEAVTAALRVVDHPWRKPNPGMLSMAASTLQLDMTRSIIVGDQISDLRAGLAAGVGCLAHVLTGHGRENRADAERFAAEHSGVLLLESVAELPSQLNWLSVSGSEAPEV